MRKNIKRYIDRAVRREVARVYRDDGQDIYQLAKQSQRIATNMQSEDPHSLRYQN